MTKTLHFVWLFEDSSDVDDDNDNNNENSRIHDNVNHNALRSLKSSGNTFNSFNLPLIARHVRSRSICGDHCSQTHAYPRRILLSFPDVAHLVNDSLDVFPAADQKVECSEPSQTQVVPLIWETKSTVSPPSRISTGEDSVGVESNLPNTTLQVSAPDHIKPLRARPASSVGSCYGRVIPYQNRSKVEQQQMNVMAASATRMIRAFDSACRLSSHRPSTSNGNRDADYLRPTRSDERISLLNASADYGKRRCNMFQQHVNANRVASENRRHCDKSQTNLPARTSQRSNNIQDRNKSVQEAKQCDQERYLRSAIRQSFDKNISYCNQCALTSSRERRHHRERERSGVESKPQTATVRGRQIDVNSRRTLHWNSNDTAHSQTNERQQHEAGHQVLASVHNAIDGEPVVENKPPLPNKFRPYSAMRLRANHFRQVIDSTSHLSADDTVADHMFTNQSSLSVDKRNVFSDCQRGTKLQLTDGLSPGATVVVSDDNQLNTYALLATGECRQSFRPDRLQSNNSILHNINTHRRPTAVGSFDTPAALSTSETCNTCETPLKNNRRLVQRAENESCLGIRVAQSSANNRYDRRSTDSNCFTDDNGDEFSGNSSSSSSNNSGEDEVIYESDEEDDDTSSSECSGAETTEAEYSSETSWSEYS